MDFACITDNSYGESLKIMRVISKNVEPFISDPKGENHEIR
jgi:hypothetical protein